MSLKDVNKFDHSEKWKAVGEVLDGFNVLKYKRYSTAGDAAASDIEDVVIVGVTDTSSGRTVTLPSSQVVDGRVYVVNDESNSASTGGISVETEGSETIDGSATASISSDSGSLTLYSNGSNWFSA